MAPTPTIIGTFTLPSIGRHDSRTRGRGFARAPALYLVCGRKIGRVGATDRPRPWSIKTAKKSLGRRALPLRTRRESPNSCLGPFVARRGEPVSARTGLQRQRRRRKLLDPMTTTARL